MKNYKVDFRTYLGELIIEAYLLPGPQNLYKKKRLTDEIRKELHEVLSKEAFIPVFLKYDGEGSVTYTDDKKHSVTFYSDDEIKV